MGPHAFYTYLSHFPDFHSKHLATLIYHLAVALCSKMLVLELLHEALHLKVGYTIGAHPGAGLNDPCKLVYGKKGSSPD